MYGDIHQNQQRKQQACTNKPTWQMNSATRMEIYTRILLNTVLCSCAAEAILKAKRLASKARVVAGSSRLCSHQAMSLMHVRTCYSKKLLDAYIQVQLNALRLANDETPSNLQCNRGQACTPIATTCGNRTWSDSPKLHLKKQSIQGLQGWGAPPRLTDP